MPLGILEPARAGHVPGTVNVWQEAQRDAELLETARHLKRTKDGRKSLIPQPTDDPNDPLVSVICDSYGAQTLMISELAIMATRPDPRNPMLCCSHRNYSLALARR